MIPTRAPTLRIVKAARTDSELLARVAGEDLSALGELYDRHHGDVRRVLDRVTGRSPDVDDLVQATFLELPKLARAFDGRCSARAWLCGLAIRLASRNRRGLVRWMRVLTSLPFALGAAPPVTPERQASDREDLVVLERSLARLTAKKRAAFLLVEVEGVSVDEAAVALQIPVSSVRTRLFHARRELRKAMRGASW